MCHKMVNIITNVKLIVYKKQGKLIYFPYSSLFLNCKIIGVPSKWKDSLSLFSKYLSYEK